MVATFAQSNRVAKKRHTSRMLDDGSRIVWAACRLHEIAIPGDLNAVGNIAGILRQLTELCEDDADRSKVLVRWLVNQLAVDQSVGHGMKGLGAPKSNRGE